MLLVFLISCEDQKDIQKTEQFNLISIEKITSSDWTTYPEETLIQIYNQGLEEYSLALAKALRDNEFRSLLKNELLKREDGDFDIIWKSFKLKQLNGESINEKIIKETVEREDMNLWMGKMNSFNDLFKQLQISMPIGIDKWDPETFSPLIAFRKVSVDGPMEYLVTINSKGQKGQVSAEFVPDYPIIVINLNERSDINGDILPQYRAGARKDEVSTKGLIPDLNPPYSVTGQYLNNYNLITWSYGNNGYNEFDVIQIEKEYYGDWALVYETPALYGPDSYIDNSIVSGYTYLYRLRTKRYDEYAIEQYSDYSPIISVTTTYLGLPAPTGSEIIAYGPNEISVSWSYPTGTNISGFKLDSRKMGFGDSFGPVTLIPPGSRNFLDLSSKEQGHKYQYRIRAYNSSEESGELLDIIYNPFRNYTEHLYLTKIKFLNINEFESWDLGTPEVQVSLAHLISPTSTDPTSIYREELILPDTIIKPRSTSYNDAEYGYNMDVLSGPWDSYFYKHVLNLNFIEYDGPGFLTGWKDFSFTTKIPIKIGKIDISITASASINWHIKKNCYDLGSTYIAFWYPEDHQIQIQDDIVITLSTTPPTW